MNTHKKYTAYTIVMVMGLFETRKFVDKNKCPRKFQCLPHLKIFYPKRAVGKN